MWPWVLGLSIIDFRQYLYHFRWQNSKIQGLVTMSIIRNDRYYQSLQKSLSKKMLCVQKVSKYFTLSTEAVIQITSHICCIFFKKCQSKPNFAFWLCLTQCQLLGSNLHVFLTTVIWPRMNSAVSKLVANLICVIKGPCVIWCASKRSVLQFNWKSCEMQFFCQTKLLPSSFQGKCFCQLPLNNARVDL